MEIFRCGNWSVTENGIKWDGKPNYFISKESIGQRGEGRRNVMYDSLVHLTEKTWLTRDDISHLNTVYIFALEYFNIGYSPNISFVKTLKEQKKLLDERDAEPEPDELTIGGGD